MGLSNSKSSSNNAEFQLILLAPNDFYRGLSTIHGELSVHVRHKLRIEKEIRIDLIGELIENKKYSRSSKAASQATANSNIFFTHSSILVTSHENGTSRTLKHQQLRYPFRITLGANLPPSCEFKEFSIDYYLRAFHDGHPLTNVNRRIFIVPPQPQITVPLPNIITGSGDVTMICSLARTFYSGRDGSNVPMSITITNPKQKQIKAVTVQLLQTVSLHGIKREHEIFTALLHEIPENTRETQIDTKTNLLLPNTLTPSFVTNERGQPENFPTLSITYEFRVTAQMKGAITPNIRLAVPIGIE